MTVKSPVGGCFPQSSFPVSCPVSSDSSSNVHHLERRSSVETVVDSIKDQPPTASEDQSLKSPRLPASSNSTEESAFNLIDRVFKINSCHSCSASSSPSLHPTSSRDMQQQQQQQRFRPPLARRKALFSTTKPSSPYPCQVASARRYSTHFPEGHQLDAQFAEAYQLQDELGSGGYGFVMTALDREDGLEVAVKFIIKDKVPEHCWINDPNFGKLPMEVVLLSFVDHESIVKCLDVFEDPVYFYLVQELHGSPWNRSHGFTLDCTSGSGTTNSTPSLSTPSLSPSISETSLPSSPRTPPLSYPLLPVAFPEGASHSPSGDGEEEYSIEQAMESKLEITKRPSYDLFECIEQSEQKRLAEEQARYVFAQVADAVHYLNALGIAHRDIKDENVVIDHNLKIIDFGSATIVDPCQPRPYYDLFYGTAAYASSEILLKRKYKAAPAEVWTLGVLLSYLLAGVSPFPTVRDAVDGRIFLSESLGLKPSANAMDLLRMCLDPNPKTRITIEGIMQHPWLHEDLSAEYS
ncbi:CAMK/CAMKL/PASK protein kinase [Coprinopsis sp. MPI-PUGE-AT-0042]|nr:CAMK/CAMKL/PASK protein kinase [Coprinopsis sp. MPI-PUGE-AT-0042]